jgi:Protein of unknown function (DUF1700)
MTMASNADKLVADYLKRLNAELRGLPRARRQELVDEISEHIAEARAALDGENEAAIRTLLDRLGEPEEIAAEARERVGMAPRKVGWKEVGALVLLPIGGVLIPVLGWIVGIVLLWVSDAWSTRDKLVGTLVVPGGLLVPVWLGLVTSESGSCIEMSSGPGPRTARTCLEDGAGGIDILKIAVIAMLVLAPLATTAYLARRMDRTPVPT